MSTISLIDFPAFGEEVARQRRARGETQAELADRAMVSRSTIAALESARREIGFLTAMRIVSALGLEFQLAQHTRKRPTLTELQVQDAAEAAEARKIGKIRR